jgi:hypothetical protein
LELEGLNAEFSDNFFDLIPNTPKTVKFQLEKEASVKSFEEALVSKTYPYT